MTVLNALIRKEILIEKGLRFNEDVSFYSDMSFVMRLLSVTSQYYLAHDACYAKREHNDPVHLPQLSQLAKKDPKKMLYDMTAVYEESYPVCEGQPKRKNLISYILCKCVLSTLDAGLCIKRDDFKIYRVLLKMHIKMCSRVLAALVRLCLYAYLMEITDLQDYLQC